jgi:sugar lactone lactonase YvrE
MISTIAGSGPAGVNLGSFSGDGGPAIDATLQEPWGIAFDAGGNLYIGDRDNYRVRRVDPSGVITTVAGTGRSFYNADDGLPTETNVAPLGIAIDPQGRLLIADPLSNRVRMVDKGSISTIAGTGVHDASGDGRKATAADVVEPGQFAFDLNGDLLIQTGTQIRRINSKGVISTIIGNGEAGVPTDGMRALDAPFPALWGTAVDAFGNIYVADDVTSVYRIDTDGVLHVFAGKQ